MPLSRFAAILSLGYIVLLSLVVPVPRTETSVAGWLREEIGPADYQIRVYEEFKINAYHHGWIDLGGTMTDVRSDWWDVANMAADSIAYHTGNWFGGAVGAYVGAWAGGAIGGLVGPWTGAVTAAFGGYAGGYYGSEAGVY